MIKMIRKAHPLVNGLLMCLVCITGIFLGCGDQQPFPATDPPPTFAFNYVLESPPGILTPNFTGSTLQGSYTGVPIVGTIYQNLGNVFSFGPSFVSFGSYYIVQGGYWPANWLISSIGGCGAGTSATYPVAQKVFTVSCVPRLLDPTVSPTSFNSQSTAFLMVSFEVPIAAGTVATMRFVNGLSGNIESQSQMTFDGSSSVIVEAPMDVPNGAHYITFDFADNGYNPGGYDAMYTLVRSTGACIPPPGQFCP